VRFFGNGAIMVIRFDDSSRLKSFLNRLFGGLEYTNLIYMNTPTPAPIRWAEDLPDGSPPSDALPPQNEEFFRLVSTIPPSERDF